MIEKFKEIGPYSNEEVPDAIQRLSYNDYMPAIVKYLMPDANVNDFLEEFRKTKTSDEFQQKYMAMALESILKKTTTEFSFNVVDNIIDHGSNYVYISNHRDILLDSALLAYSLSKRGLDTPEITFGNNLMKGDFIIDFGKINKMFRIIRDGNMRDFYKNAIDVSEYIRYVITQKKQSVWIAQRNGRTKNGDDKTEMAVLKMFALGSSKEFVESLSELNICPMAVSYEYEPCDFLKAAELYVTKYQKYYIKAANEDFNSIIQGITQIKGEVSFTVCKPITIEEIEFCSNFDKNERYNALAKIIDKRIYSNYKLFKNNYIAFDVLHYRPMFKNLYTEDEKQIFLSYMRKGIEQLSGEKEELTNIFLDIYANPVKNVIGL